MQLRDWVVRVACAVNGADDQDGTRTASLDALEDDMLIVSDGLLLKVIAAVLVHPFACTILLHGPNEKRVPRTCACGEL